MFCSTGELFYCGRVQPLRETIIARLHDIENAPICSWWLWGLFAASWAGICGKYSPSENINVNKIKKRLDSCTNYIRI
jgi:hypothetical protein